MWMAPVTAIFPSEDISLCPKRRCLHGAQGSCGCGQHKEAARARHRFLYTSCRSSYAPGPVLLHKLSEHERVPAIGHLYH